MKTPKKVVVPAAVPEVPVVGPRPDACVLGGIAADALNKSTGQALN